VVDLLTEEFASAEGKVGGELVTEGANAPIVAQALRRLTPQDLRPVRPEVAAGALTFPRPYVGPAGVARRRVRSHFDCSRSAEGWWRTEVPMNAAARMLSRSHVEDGCVRATTLSSTMVKKSC